MPRRLAVDLGTETLRIADPDGRLLLTWPSVVAADERKDAPVAAGPAAVAAVEREPERLALRRPLRGGAVVDLPGVTRLLTSALRHVGAGRRCRLVGVVPADLTPVERRALQACAEEAGAAELAPLEAPLAAALGAGLPVGEPAGSAVVVAGAGVTEAAVVSLGGLAVRRSTRIGGHDLQRRIRDHLRADHRLSVGVSAAADLLQLVASAHPAPPEPRAEVAGRDLATGRRATCVVDGARVRTVLSPALARIATTVREMLAACPPQLSHDVMRRGIFLAGGMARLSGLAAMLEIDTGVPVMIVDEPDTAPLAGASTARAALSELRPTLAG